MRRLRRFRLPHPLVLLVVCVFIAAAASWVLPAGRFERHDDPATGRSVVVPGTYHRVAPAPVGPFQAVVAIPKGLEAAADVVFLVFLVGGAFTVVEQTGALRRAVGRLVQAMARRETWVIPIVSAAFALGGLTENMQEEIIAFVPILLVLARQLGFDALTACAMSVGSAAVGAAFSPINPFQVQIAQKLAQLQPGSGGLFRTAFLLLALTLWTWAIVRHGARVRAARVAVGPAAGETEAELAAAEAEVAAEQPLGWRLTVVLLLVAAAFVMLVVGLQVLGWGFDELSALFLVMGVAAGLIAGLGIAGTTNAFVEGFRGMTTAALLIGFARAISVVLEEGQVLDTLVHGLFAPLAGLPVAASAAAMMAAQALVHVPVPSVSGQAVLTMPILVPLSDLLGLSRQVTVLAYQYGAGLTELLTPTNGALMAILAAAGVGFDEWLRFAVRWVVLLALLGLVAMGVAVAVGL
ncbi:MAG TPA: Na+/H+ antiporter NhaC family protein [Gemmatimonadales bacterium]|nr:Na+/H+ antiporter NhaC family protein [Gemmatimonadales bacterium]